MAQSATLKAEVRGRVGSRDARKLRGAGRLPCNLQGLGEGDSPYVNLHLDRHEFMNSRRAHVHLYDLELEGELHPAVVRELQWDDLGEQLLHVEFKRVIRGMVTEAEVELEIAGMPKNGVVNLLVQHVTVSTLPANIPDSIIVKVGELEEGDHVKASDLELPEGVTLVEPPGLEVLVISGQRVVLEPAPGAAEVGEAAPEAAEGAEGGEEEGQ